MDDLNNHDFELDLLPILTGTIPDAILEEYSNDFYRVCWKPTDAGVVPTEPRLISKQELAERFPHVVAAWEARQRAEKEDATQKEGNFVAFAGQFLNRRQDKRHAAPSQRQVDCDQSLLPGMGQHWGELRSCETHPLTRPDVHVCKGCRVAHYARESRTFNRQLIMARGARVAVCEECAATAVETHGIGHRGCVCDSRWTCFRCREGELVDLAKAREKHTEGRCGGCSQASELVQHVDFCLHCRKWRVYATSSAKT